MIKTIDMAHMRYINLFQKISHVSPQHCFIYNSAIILAVPESQLKKAMGDNGRNLKKMSEILGKKIKVVLVPDGIGDAEKFISTIVYPTEIKGIEIDGNTLVINAGSQNKAILIGRNKTRLEEMKKIVKGYFGKEVRIV